MRLLEARGIHYTPSVSAASPPQPRTVFLALCWLGGVSLAALMPPLGNADEQVHLARAYLISEGTFLPPAEGAGSFPKSLVELEARMAHAPPMQPARRFRSEEIRAALEQPLRPDERVPAGALSYYTPLVYLPQALAIGVARRLDAAPAVLVYAGRLANLAAYAALGWLALGRAAVARWPLCLLLLLPMAVSEAASLSGDAATLAAAVLFVALASRAAWGPGAPERGPLALAASGALLGCMKPGYWPVAALVLWIPAERLAGRRARVVLLGAVAAAVIGPYALWGAWLAAHGVSAIHGSADPGAQLAGILTSPFAFAGVLARTIGEGFATYVESFVGMLGRLNVHLPGPLWTMAPLALAASALAEPPLERGPSPAARAALALLFAAGIALVFTLAYVSVNAPGARFVSGVQGRYFLPFAPLGLLAIPPLGGRGSRAEAAPAVCAGLWAALLLAGAAHAVWTAYYDGR